MERGIRKNPSFYYDVLCFYSHLVHLLTYKIVLALILGEGSDGFISF